MYRKKKVLFFWKFTIRVNSNITCIPPPPPSSFQILQQTHTIMHIQPPQWGIMPLWLWRCFPKVFWGLVVFFKPSHPLTLHSLSCSLPFFFSSPMSRFKKPQSEFSKVAGELRHLSFEHGEPEAEEILLNKGERVDTVHRWWHQIMTSSSHWLHFCQISSICDVLNTSPCPASLGFLKSVNIMVCWTLSLQMQGQNTDCLPTLKLVGTITSWSLYKMTWSRLCTGFLLHALNFSSPSPKPSYFRSWDWRQGIRITYIHQSTGPPAGAASPCASSFCADVNSRGGLDRCSSRVCIVLETVTHPTL